MGCPRLGCDWNIGPLQRSLEPEHAFRHRAVDVLFLTASLVALVILLIASGLLYEWFV